MHNTDPRRSAAVAEANQTAAVGTNIEGSRRDWLRQQCELLDERCTKRLAADSWPSKGPEGAPMNSNHWSGGGLLQDQVTSSREEAAVLDSHHAQVGWPSDSFSS